MIKMSLFAEQEREAKPSKLGDALKVTEQHSDLVTLPMRLTKWLHARAANAAGVLHFQPN
ncbi:hypothetical protein PO883_34290 [Massilia sp. DJPM01]|uniref:hypothetical protein n=1 Tax=Massilia sp. DJPM01 TaxID=3024404 RepID=UPI00259D578F|nr:hypothetical protein [Massilia sp. DJPM01]MDM5182239.1 hypothetical protein [Massilia sp. DJPM01]